MWCLDMNGVGVTEIMFAEIHTEETAGGLLFGAGVCQEALHEWTVGSLVY